MLVWEGVSFPKTPCAFRSEPRLRLLFGSWRRRSVLPHAPQGVGGSSCLDKPPLSWVASLTANAGPAPRAHPRRRAASSKCRLSVLSRTLRREWTAPGALSDVPLGVCCSVKKLSCASSVGAMAQSRAAGRDGARNRAYQTLGPSNARRRGGFRPNCNSSGGAVVVEVGAQLWGSTLSGELMLLLLCRYLPSTSRVNFELDIRIRQNKSLRSPVSSLLRILFVPCRNPRSISSPVAFNCPAWRGVPPSTSEPGPSRASLHATSGNFGMTCVGTQPWQPTVW